MMTADIFIIILPVPMAEKYRNQALLSMRAAGPVQGTAGEGFFLMTKMADAGEKELDAEFSGGPDHFGVPDGTSGFDQDPDLVLGRQFDRVGKRKISVGQENRSRYGRLAFVYRQFH
jgi:hypothetical protein